MADPYWFVPRRFGYGATPVTWQGWVLTVAMVAPLLVDSVWWRSRWGVFGGAVVLAGGLALAYVKTSEPWRWRF